MRTLILLALTAAACFADGAATTSIRGKLTQRDGNVFLVGFNRSGSDDWMDLFAVDVDAPSPAMLKKIAKKHMFCTNGCTFRHGAGIYAASPTHFEVYAVNGDSGDHVTGTTIHANHFLST